MGIFPSINELKMNLNELKYDYKSNELKMNLNELKYIQVKTVLYIIYKSKQLHVFCSSLFGFYWYLCRWRQFYKLKINLKTRMHSSRMRIDRSLTVCRSLLLGGVLIPGGVLSPRECT